MRTQETAERLVRVDAEQALHVRFGQIPKAVFFKRKSFKRATSNFAGRAEPAGEIVRNANSNVHTRKLCSLGREVKVTCTTRISGLVLPVELPAPARPVVLI